MTIGSVSYSDQASFTYFKKITTTCTSVTNVDLVAHSTLLLDPKDLHNLSVRDGFFANESRKRCLEQALLLFGLKCQ